jgi:hypothetical protein
MTDYELSPIKVTPFMSIVEGRTPRQKVHTHLAHAKNAFDPLKINKKIVEISPNGMRWVRHTHGWGAIFEHKDGEWKLLFEIPQPTEADGTQGKWNMEYETRPWKLDN